MRSNFFGLGVVVSGLLAVGLVATGCETGSTLPGASEGSGAHSSSSNEGGNSQSNGSTGTGETGGGNTGGGGQGIHSIAGAGQITIDDSAGTAASLVDATTPDYYKFTGKKGDRLVVELDAASLGQDPYDPATIDGVVALIGSDGKTVVTWNDNAWPTFGNDPLLFVQLPADGDYYLQVTDCNGFYSSGCPTAPSAIKNFDYQLFVGHVNEANAGTAQDGTSAKAVSVAYANDGTTGEYSFNVIGGAFQSATDKTHVFKLDIPADVAVDATARARAEFWLQPIGATDGDASAANVKLRITDDADGKNVIAAADQNNYSNPSDGAATNNGPLDLSFPFKPGSTYYLWVDNTATGGDSSSNYYFIQHGLGVYFNQAEVETAAGTNDSPDCLLYTSPSPRD